MGRIPGGIALLAVAAFMLLGFFRSGAPLAAPATLTALLIGVVLPAVGGIVLLRHGHGRDRQLDDRRETLRQQTLDAEVLRLAGERGGRITAVELMTELTLPDDVARSTLESLMVRGLADIEVSDAGVLVYVFHDVRHLGSRDSSRKVLE
jgi:hypothetical protein